MGGIKMEYSKILELTILKFLRVRIGTHFTPDELLAEMRKVCLTTDEDFHIMLRILAMEELIAVSFNEDNSTEIVKVLNITKDGLKLLREKKH